MTSQIALRPETDVPEAVRQIVEPLLPSGAYAVRVEAGFGELRVAWQTMDGRRGETKLIHGSTTFY